MNKLLKLLFLFCAMACPWTVFSQSMLRGIVRDGKEALIGATVYVVNANQRVLNGVVTNENGEYSLPVSSEKNISIVFSFIGYQSVTIPYKNQKVLNITLKEDITNLDEVVVSAERINRGITGIPDKNSGVASQKIDMDDMKEMQVTSIEDALQGRMSNVDIVAMSGDPGSRSAIRIRGTSSLNASSEPLIVVDDIPYNTEIGDGFDFATADEEDYGALVNVAPSDIQSIEVLKDAAATAIWGSKGANGVLLITTKRGSQGKTRFSISQKFDYKREPAQISLLDGRQYVTMVQDAMWNRLFDEGFDDWLMKTMTEHKEINFDPSWELYDEYNQNTDWVDLITKTALTSETNFSMSGGGDRALYRFSVGYLNEGGTTVGTGFNRLTTRLNVDYNFSTKLRVSAGFSFAQGEKDDNYTQSGVNKAREEARIRMPNMSPFLVDKDGNMTSEYFTPQSNYQGDWNTNKRFNPLAMVNDSYNNTKNKDIRMTFGLRYHILSSLLFQSDIGFDISSSKNVQFLPQSVTGVTFTHADFNKSMDNMTESLNINMNHKLIYTHHIAEGQQMILTAMLQTNDYSASKYYSTVSGVSSVNGSDPSSEAKIRKLDSESTQNRTFGAVFSAHYNFKERYMLTATYRREGNSRMGQSTRWGGFPSVAAVWRISEESFLKPVEFVNDIKVRASWGQSGNSPSGSFPYIGTFVSNGSYINKPAVKPKNIQLNHLKWEVVTQKNLGLDVALWKNNLMMTMDIYDKVTDDLLQQDVKISSATGFGTVNYFNSGKVRNYGWEFRIDIRNVVKAGRFNLGFNLNIARNQNEIKELPSNMKSVDYTFGNGNYAQMVHKGEPLGAFYGYRYQGVYQNAGETIACDRDGVPVYNLNGKPVYTSIKGYQMKPGDAHYEDINHDGVIDDYDLVYIGNSMPSLTGGFGININYGDFKLRTFFHSRLGQSVINRTRINMENMYGSNNQSQAVLKRWRHEGDQTDIPRALSNRGYNWLGSDRFVDDASFLRLKQLTLSYSFPKVLIRKCGISRAEVYVTGYDLFTWTKYKGQDPEVGFVRHNLYEYAEDKASTPRPVRMALGLSVDF